MIENIKETILHKLFYTMSKGCSYCLRKARHYIFEDVNYTKAKIWNNLGKMFNKMERRILTTQYGEAL